MSRAKDSVCTVTGNVEPARLGVTLPHEHVIHRICIHSHKADNTFVDTDLIADELGVFREAGGGTVCDATPIGLGRDPKALQQVSLRSGVTIVSGVGLYQLEIWPDKLRRMTRRELADLLAREADGESAGIRAGFIGEISSHNEPDHSDWRRYRLWEEEEKIFRATADAQRRSGLAVLTHASMGRAGVAQLRLMIESGGDPRRIVIGHCDCQMHEDIETDFDYYHTLLDEGAQLEFDLFGWDEMMPDAERFKRVAALAAEGFADRILLSTDTCRLSQLHRHGGRGFDYLLTSVLPQLKAAGVAEKKVQQMTVANPARLLTPAT